MSTSVKVVEQTLSTPERCSTDLHKKDGARCWVCQGLALDLDGEVRRVRVACEELPNGRARLVLMGPGCDRRFVAHVWDRASEGYRDFAEGAWVSRYAEELVCLAYGGTVPRGQA